MAGDREFDLAVAWLLLGDISRERRRGEEAAARYERALSYNSELPRLRAHYADVLAGLGRKDEAIRVLETAVERAPGDPALLDALAAAYAEAGRYDEAVTVAVRGAEAADRLGQQQLAATVRTRADLYRARQPHRTPRP